MTNNATHAYAHQDWTTVVLNKKGAAAQKQTVARGSGQTQTVSSTTNKPAWKIEQQVDSDTGKPIKYVSKQDADALKNMRIALKLTQGELATKLNMKVKDIQDIETAKAIENKSILASMKSRMQRLIDALQPVQSQS